LWHTNTICNLIILITVEAFSAFDESDLVDEGNSNDNCNEDGAPEAEPAPPKAPKLIQWAMALRAVDRFYLQHGRLPGSDAGLFIYLLALFAWNSRISSIHWHLSVFFTIFVLFVCLCGAGEGESYSAESATKDTELLKSIAQQMLAEMSMRILEISYSIQFWISYV
jgi:hypothetical protein